MTLPTTIGRAPSSGPVGPLATTGPENLSRRALLTGAGFGAVAAGLVYGAPFAGLRRRLRDLGFGSSGDGSDDWEAAADERIATHRTTPLTVTVVDTKGEPVPYAHVEVRQRSHAFGFGTAVNASQLVEESETAEHYREVVTDLFNTVVLENHHKWGFWETPEERRLAEDATDWLIAEGLRMRGHTCIWQKRGEGAIPGDVTDAVDARDGEYVSRRAREHTAAIVDHYAAEPSLSAWDVLNEPVDQHVLTDIIEPDTAPEDAMAPLEWFDRAKAADPEATLFVNEYSVLAGDDEEHRQAFEAVVHHLLANDAPLGGIGLQSHHWSVDHRRAPAELFATLDRFAELVPSIVITEYDTWGEEWTEAMEAAYLHRFLKTAFSHPAVDGFVMWGFWDEIHWHENAPLFRADWSRKPAYDVYADLIFGEWWTDQEGDVDATGQYTTEAILGDYDVTASVDERESAKSVALTDPTGERVEVRLELPG